MRFEGEGEGEMSTTLHEGTVPLPIETKAVRERMSRRGRGRAVGKASLRHHVDEILARCRRPQLWAIEKKQ